MTEPKRRGRKPLTEEEKAKRKLERDLKKESSLKSNSSKNKSESTSKSVKQEDVSKMTSIEKLSYVHQLLEKTTTGIVVMEDGKTYTKVSERIKKIREVFGFDLKIVSNVVDFDNQKVRVEAQVWIKENGNWDLVQTANAFEEKNSSFYNKTSYVEVAETSAIGRALGFLGLFGDEFASGEEVSNSVNSEGKNSNKPTSNIRKASKDSSVKDKRVNSEQIKYLNDFLNNNKNYTMSELLANVKATKLEELSFSEAESIINLIKLNDMDESPL